MKILKTIMGKWEESVWQYSSKILMAVFVLFAFKDIASNAFAGLLLSMQRPFKNMTGWKSEINSVWSEVSV